MFSRPLTNEEVWDKLPLSKEQREAIIKDFIETNQYDKIEENEWLDSAGGDTPAQSIAPVKDAP